MRLFIVDDVLAARALVRAVAEEVGYEVVGEAPDGEVACDVVPEVGPDVVVMDWQMPKVDGLKATRFLVDRMPHLAVVAYSAIDGATIGEHFRAAGAVAHVGKGDIVALREVLKDLQLL